MKTREPGIPGNFLFLFPRPGNRKSREFRKLYIVPEQGKYLGSIPNFEPEFKIQFRLENIRVNEEQGENWFGVFEIGNECSTKCL